jgi:hypothetical protein
MKNESSKVTMNESLELLKTIKRVDVPEHLYDAILSKIDQRKQPIVSMKWVRAAAAILLCLVSIEVYLFTKTVNKQNNSLELLVELPNNMLYHE